MSGLKALTQALALGLGVLAAAHAQDIRITGLFKDKALVEIDGKQRLLRQGEISPEGVKLVSANAREAVLEVNGARGSYRLGGHISNSYAPPDRSQVSVQIWPDSSGGYRVIGSINGYPVKMLVDTGATTIAMNAAEAKRLGLDFRVIGQPSMASTAGGVVRSYMVVLQRVKIGDIELRNVEAAVIDGTHPTDVLLGMSFLGRLDLAEKGQMLELTKPY